MADYSIAIALWLVIWPGVTAVLVFSRLELGSRSNWDSHGGVTGDNIYKQLCVYVSLYIIVWWDHENFLVGGDAMAREKKIRSPALDDFPESVPGFLKSV